LNGEKILVIHKETHLRSRARPGGGAGSEAQPRFQPGLVKPAAGEAVEAHATVAR
jgi:hypothetical protein